MMKTLPLSISPMKSPLSSKQTGSKLPCPKCPSSDAYHEFDDGHAKCHSCGYFRPPTGHQPIDPIDGTFQFLPIRGITREVCNKYNIATKVSPTGEPLSVGFHYPNGGIKTRLLNDKVFSWSGKTDGPCLFGENLFPPASAKSITITEGEFDAASVLQILGPTSPSVSVRSSVTARRDCQGSFDYLNSFEKIILCLDDDEPGRKAARDIAGLFDYNKVYQAHLGELKDANAYLQAGREREFRTIWSNAKRYTPEGVISSFSEFDTIIDADADKHSVPYPFDILNAKERGIRSGEFILVKAQEGVGKTEFLRAIEYHLLKTTAAKIGAIHLEESKARQLKGVAGYELGAPAHLSESGITNDDIKAAYRKVTEGPDGETRLHIYSHFGSDDPDILLDIVRFLAAVCECKYIFLDHITMVVSGLDDEKDERRRLDYISTALAKMAHDLDFTIFCVSHVNDDGKTRGSRNIQKVAHTIIDISRDLENPAEEERNKMYLKIPKARWTGNTGPAGVLGFSRDTYKLTDFDPTLLPVE